MWDEHNTRNLILLLRLSGWLLLRAHARTLFGLLFQEPPRSTRASSQGTPQNSILPCKYDLFLGGNAKKRARRCAAHSERQISASVFSAPVICYSMGDEHNTRNPISLPRESGWS